MLASLPLGAVVGCVRGEQNGSGLLELKQKRHVAGGMTGRLEQADRPVAEEVELPLGELPAQLGPVVVLADVSGRKRSFGRAGGLELAAVHDDRGVREVAECAGVIDVQMSL